VGWSFGSEGALPMRNWSEVQRGTRNRDKMGLYFLCVHRLHRSEGHRRPHRPIKRRVRRWRPTSCGGEGEDRESPSICGERGERWRPCAAGLFRGGAMQGSRGSVQGRCHAGQPRGCLGRHRPPARASCRGNGTDQGACTVVEEAKNDTGGTYRKGWSW
jgi:hypothetical protein